MSRISIVHNGVEPSFIFYVEDVIKGSSGYKIDYRKGTYPKISYQCRLKVIDRLIFNNEYESEMYLEDIIEKTMELKKSIGFNLFEQCVIKHDGKYIVLFMKRVSSWDTEFLSQNDIRRLILFEERK